MHLWVSVLNQGLDTFTNAGSLKCLTWKANFLTGSVCTSCASAIKASPAVNHHVWLWWRIFQTCYVKGKSSQSEQVQRANTAQSLGCSWVISTLCQFAGIMTSAIPSGRCRGARMFLDYQWNSADEILWIGGKTWDISVCLVTSLIPEEESQCSGLFVTTGPITLSC